MGKFGVLLVPLLQMVMLATAQSPTCAVSNGLGRDNTGKLAVGDCACYEDCAVSVESNLALETLGLPMKIDTHCHFVPSWYREIFNARKIEASAGFNVPKWDAESHLLFNAKFGITTSVVSAVTPGAKFSKDAPVDEGRDLARRLNEDGYNLTVQYPKQFLFFATLTLPDLEGAVTEAVYALDTLKAAGIVLPASSFEELLGTPRYAPLYKELNHRNAIVFIHPNLFNRFEV